MASPSPNRIRFSSLALSFFKIYRQWLRVKDRSQWNFFMNFLIEVNKVCSLMEGYVDYGSGKKENRQNYSRGK